MCPRVQNIKNFFQSGCPVTMILMVKEMFCSILLKPQLDQMCKVIPAKLCVFLLIPIVLQYPSSNEVDMYVACLCVAGLTLFIFVHRYSLLVRF